MESGEDNNRGGRKRFVRMALWGAVCLVTMAVALVVFGKTLRDGVLGAPPETRAASTGYLRRPIGKEAFAYQTMFATQRPDGPRQSYSVSVQRGDRLELGLVRIGTEFSEPIDYVFSAYAKTPDGRKKLFETSGSYRVNSWKLSRTEVEWAERDGGETEIEYVLKPKGIMDRIASVPASVTGWPYYKDFAFITPNVLRRRDPGELNVLLVVLDTLRADRLGCLGYTRPTSPHIDEFARRGILFTHATTPSPWTLPAHFSLLTGLYPSAQLDRNDNGWETRSSAGKLMAGILSENGYYTIATGSLPHATGLGAGFDRFRKFNYVKVARKSFSTRKIFTDAMDWLDANRDTKFFMLIHNYECHIPYEGAHFLEEGAQSGLASTRSALYDGDVRSLDGFFGELVEKLESLGLLSSTIVVVASDHGEHFYDHFSEDDRIPPGAPPTPEVSNIDHGHSVHDELVRVPVIFHLPASKPAKNVFENRIRLIDVLPTVLDYLDVAYDGPMQGASLLQLIEDGRRAEEPPAISEFTFSGPEQKSVVLNGYKYIYTAQPDEKKLGVGYRNIPKYALFDLKNDPGEQENIFDRNKELARKYHAILEETMGESLEIKSRLDSNRQIGKGGSTELPEDVIESLEALGYLK